MSRIIAPPAVVRIITEEAARAGVEPLTLVSGDRKKRYSHPRFHAIRRCREELTAPNGRPFSTTMVARWFNLSDHTTVLNAQKRSRELLAVSV